jgi:hypothetical protein
MLMASLSRVPLASLVCPSAPFLAPRLLRTAAASTCTRAYATKPTPKPKPKPKPKPTTTTKTKPPPNSLATIRTKYRNKKGHVRYNVRAVDEHLAPLVQIRSTLAEACKRCDAATIMELYPALLSASALQSGDTYSICQALHGAFRTSMDKSKYTELFLFVQTLTADLRRGALEPHPSASIHLLAIYRDTKNFAAGRELWEWLVEHDDHVSPGVYGVAIELLAYGRLISLPDLEALYSEALKRFPGTFSEYHLSPDAVVPDRTRPVQIFGASATLLQGIIAARLLARDWKNAYLALDTSLRLFPSQTPTRVFELFIQSRPASEAYTAFLVACRAGVRLNPRQVRRLFSDLNRTAKSCRSLSERMMLLRAVVNAIYASMQAGNKLDDTYVDVLFQNFAGLLPAKLPGEGYRDEDAELRDIIVVTAHQVAASLLQSGLPPNSTLFSSLVLVAGRLQVPNLLDTALRDIQLAGLKLDDSQSRRTLESAGYVSNHALIEKLWLGIVVSAEGRGLSVDYKDWITFARACRRANHTDFFYDQLSKLEHTLYASLKERIHAVLQTQDLAEDTNFTYDLTPAQLKSEMDLLQEQMKNIEAVNMSGTPLDYRKSPFYMHMDPDHPSLGSDENLRAVYDEYTTDPYQPPLPAPTDDSLVQASLSPTGMPLDELRFRNWVTVLEMMNEAEAYEAERTTLVNQAIAAQTPASEPEALRIHNSKEDITDSQEALRLKVKQLRLPNPASTAQRS